MGGYCWYCYWGWPDYIMDIYQRALKDLEYDEFPLLYGPGHIVWDDENFDSAEWCLEHFEEYRGGYSDEDLAIVRRSLEELSRIPLDKRCIEPEDYEGEHPELFPPPDGIKMVEKTI